MQRTVVNRTGHVLLLTRAIEFRCSGSNNVLTTEFSVSVRVFSSTAVKFFLNNTAFERTDTNRATAAATSEHQRV